MGQNMTLSADSTVDIIVKAKPNSYVGVLGVDQSVLLLRSGNDITKVPCLFSR